VQLIGSDPLKSLIVSSSMLLSSDTASCWRGCPIFRLIIYPMNQILPRVRPDKQDHAAEGVRREASKTRPPRGVSTRVTSQAGPASSHRSRVQQVSGYSIPEPRMTVTAWLLIFCGVVLPVLLLGAIGDGLLQVFFGLCTGLWC